MAKTVKITLAAAGTDTGPFNIYSNLDYVNAINTAVPKSSLLSGYTSTVVPDTATSIRVKSTGSCVNYVDMIITSNIIDFTIDNPIQFPYPVVGSNGSASGTITNNSGSTIYVYAHFNSGGNSSGTINGDGGGVAGGFALDIPSGPITAYGQDFYSTNYETLISNNISVNWSLIKNDGFTNGSEVTLVYSTTIGGTKLPFNY